MKQKWLSQHFLQLDSSFKWRTAKIDLGPLLGLFIWVT